MNVKREPKSKTLSLSRETLKSLSGGWYTHPIQSDPKTGGTDCSPYISMGCAGGGGGGPGSGVPSIGGPSGCVECVTN